MKSENDSVSLLPLGEYLSAINESESNRRTLVAVSDDPDECLDLLVTLSKLEDREQELLEYRCKLKLFSSESNTKIAEVIGTKIELRGQHVETCFSEADEKLYPNYLQWTQRHSRVCLSMQRFRDTVVDTVKTLGFDVRSAGCRAVSGLAA